MVGLFEAEVEGCYFLTTPCRVGVVTLSKAEKFNVQSPRR
jgi:hypothetical protein